MVFWFTVSKDTDNIYPDTLFGVIYVPPENTKYSSPECFLEIDREMLDISKTSDNVCLIGDFNARIGELPDFVDSTTS